MLEKLSELSFRTAQGAICKVQSILNSTAAYVPSAVTQTRHRKGGRLLFRRTIRKDFPFRMEAPFSRYITSENSRRHRQLNACRLEDNMKNALIITVASLTVVLGFPATEEKSTTTVSVKAIIESTKVTQDVGAPFSAGRLDRNPTVRCEHIHPADGEAGPQNHRACLSHCRALTEMYTNGSCSENGICICERALRRGEPSPGNYFIISHSKN